MKGKICGAIGAYNFFVCFILAFTICIFGTRNVYAEGKPLDVTINQEEEGGDFYTNRDLTKDFNPTFTNNGKYQAELAIQINFPGDDKSLAEGIRVNNSFDIIKEEFNRETGKEEIYIRLKNPLLPGETTEKLFESINLRDNMTMEEIQALSDEMEASIIVTATGDIPIEPTEAPTVDPTKEPTGLPTDKPTSSPTLKPTQDGADGGSVTPGNGGGTYTPQGGSEEERLSAAGTFDKNSSLLILLAVIFAMAVVLFICIKKKSKNTYLFVIAFLAMVLPISARAAGNTGIDGITETQSITVSKRVIFNVNKTSYTVSFDTKELMKPAGAVANDPKNQIVPYNGRVTRPAPEPMSSGWNFTYWAKEDKTTRFYFEDQADPNTMLSDKQADRIKEDTRLYARWQGDGEVKYTVEYFQMDTNEEYPRSATITENYTAVPGEFAVATPKYFEGFTFDESNESNEKEGLVAGDGSTTLKLYYTRNKYSVTFKAGKTEDPTGVSDALYETNVQNPGDLQAPGYEFKGWYDNKGTGELKDEDKWDFTDDKVPSGDVTLYAGWEPGKNTPYTIAIYQEDVNGNIPNTPTQTDSKTGTTDETVDISKTDYITNAPWGFRVSNPTDMTGVISPNGDLVLRVTYTRIRYDVFFNNNGHGRTAPDGKYDLPFGSTIEKPEDPIQPGYTFKGWYTDRTTQDETTLWKFNDVDDATTIPNNDTTLYAAWQENDPVVVSCQVETYKNDRTTKDNVNVGGTVTPESQTVRPVTEDLRIFTATPNPGYSFDGGYYQGEKIGEMESYLPPRNPDGTYENRTYQVRFVENDDVLLNFSIHENRGTLNKDSQRVAPVSGHTQAITATAKPGYTFSKWQYGTDGVTNTFLTNEATLTPQIIDSIAKARGIYEPVTFRAYFEKNTDTSYRINYYRENASDDDYTLVQSDNTGKGATESFADISGNINRYTEFSLDAAATTYKDSNHVTPQSASLPIAGDGSLEINLYYKRNKHRVEFSNNGIGTGAPQDIYNVKYQATVQEPIGYTMSAHAYDFAGWYTSPTDFSDANKFIFGGEPNATTMPDRDIILYAKWIEHADVTISFNIITLDKNGQQVQSSLGGSVTGTNPQVLPPAHGVAANVTANPNNGYYFEGWYDEDMNRIKSDRGFTPPRNSYSIYDTATYTAIFREMDGVMLQFEKQTYLNDGVTVDNVNTGGFLSPAEPQTLNPGSGDATPVTATPRPGYTFTGWYKEGALVTQDTTLTPPKTGDVYVTATYTAEFKENSQVTLSFVSNDTSMGTVSKANITLAPVSGLLRDTITATPAIGYHHVKWASSLDERETNSETLTPVQISNVAKQNGYYIPATFTAYFEPNRNTQYNVEVYKEDLRGNYVLDNALSHKGAGTTNEQVIGTPKEIEGYVLNTTLTTWTDSAHDTEQIGTPVVSADGSLVIKCRYDRRKYDLKFNYLGHGGTDTVVNDVAYGALITEPVNPAEEGYDFAGWYTSKDDMTPTTLWDFGEDTMPAVYVQIGSETFNLYAKWIPKTNVHYTIENYFQNPEDDEYTLVASKLQNRYDGVTGLECSATELQGNDINGFTFDESNVNNVVKAQVKGDGSTVLKFYYNRNLYTITYDANGHGVAPASVTARYGARISSPAIPADADYMSATGFWFKDNTCVYQWDFDTDTMPIGGDTLYCQWEYAFFLSNNKDNPPAGSVIRRPDEIIQAADDIAENGTASVHYPQFLAYMQQDTFDAATGRYNPSAEHLYTRVSRNGDAGDYLEARIVDLNRSPISGQGGMDSPGHAGITFQAIHAINSPVQMNDTATNAGGYNGSKLKESVSVGGTLYTYLNDTFTGAVRDIDVDGGSCRFWIGAREDLTGDNAYSFWKGRINETGSNSALASLIETRQGASLTGSWLRDASAVNNTGFGYITSAGSINGETAANDTLGFAPYFAFGVPTTWHIQYNAGDGAFGNGEKAVLERVAPTGDKKAKGPIINDEIAIPHRKGYTFKGWYTDSSCSGGNEFTLGTAVRGAMELYAGWQENSVTITYGVKTYYNTGSDEEGIIGGTTTLSSQTINADTGSPVSVTAGANNGFEFVGWYKNGAFLSADLDITPVKGADGLFEGSKYTAVFKEKTAVTLRFAVSNIKMGSVSPTSRMLPPASGVATDVVVYLKPGYHLTSWSNDSDNSTFSENTLTSEQINQVAKKTGAYVPVTFTANLAPNTNTRYKVYHWQENADDDGFTLVDTEDKTGTTDESPDVTQKTYVGFDFNPAGTTYGQNGVAQAATALTIAGDGSLEVNLYYNRQVFNLTYNANGHGTAPAGERIKQGAHITKPERPRDTDDYWLHTGDWFTESGCTVPWDFSADTMPIRDLELFAKWERPYIWLARKNNPSDIIRYAGNDRLMANGNLKEFCDTVGADEDQTAPETLQARAWMNSDTFVNKKYASDAVHLYTCLNGKTFDDFLALSLSNQQTSNDYLEARIVGVHQDIANNPIRYTGMTFMMTHAFTQSYRMNPTDTNVGGYIACELRSKLQPGGEVYNMFDENAMKYITTAAKYCAPGGTLETPMAFAEDQLWPVSYHELTGSVTSAWSGSPGGKALGQEGPQYEFWSDKMESDYYQNDCLKNMGFCRNGDKVSGVTNPIVHAGFWWMRSPEPKASGDFLVTGDLGAVHHNYDASEKYGLLLGFTI